MPKNPLNGPNSTTVGSSLPLPVDRATSIWPLLKTVSTGNFTPSSKTCPTKVDIAYRFGVVNDSMPKLDFKNRGIDAEINAGSAECKIVGKVSVKGGVQLGRVRKVASIDRGGWVDGVSINLVRAMSKGARMRPATPAAETATVSEARGEGEDKTSRPPAEVKLGAAVKDNPGSGRTRKAEKKDLRKDVSVEIEIE